MEKKKKAIGNYYSLQKVSYDYPLAIITRLISCIITQQKIYLYSSQQKKETSKRVLSRPAHCPLKAKIVMV